MAEQTGTNIGTLLAIASTLPASETQTAYEGLTWVNIGKVVSIGERGQQTDDLTVEFLSDGIRRHRKGTVDFGVFPVVIEPSFADQGQDVIRTHVNSPTTSDQDVAIRETDPSGNIRYYSGLLVNYRHSEASPGTNETVTFELRANTPFIQVEA